MEGSCRAAQLVFVFIGQLLEEKKGSRGIGRVVREWKGCKGRVERNEGGARKVLNSVHPEDSCKNFLMCRC